MPLPQPELFVLRQAQRGSERAFAELVRTYETPVFNYVLRLVGDRSLAEDLTQEVFLRVFQGLPNFSLRCRFTTWLFQVTKNRVLDELRAVERRPRAVVALVFVLDGGAVEGALAPAGAEIDLSDRRYLLNPGSVGQPRDGDPRAAYLVLDLEARRALFRRVPYPIERTQQEIRDQGLPETLAARLAHGM